MTLDRCSGYCTDCGGPLGANRWRCAACQLAARRAIMRAGPGQVVKPSDVAAAREDAT